MGGGAGTRLFPLTKTRAKPAVPIGGLYRLIDVPMVRCMRAGTVTCCDSFMLCMHVCLGGYLTCVLASWHAETCLWQNPQSNCINSGISKIYILTQFNSTSLNRHLSRAYNMGSGVRFGGEGFVEVLSATQTPTDGTWFQGTADAVRQYTWMLSDIKNRVIEDVVILSGDHL